MFSNSVSNRTFNVISVALLFAVAVMTVALRTKTILAEDGDGRKEYGKDPMRSRIVRITKATLATTARSCPLTSQYSAWFACFLYAGCPFRKPGQSVCH